jgi:hypothetical protein
MDTSIPLEWVARIRERPEFSLPALIRICAAISKKDPSFKYETGGDRLGQFIDIICESEDEAHRRAAWLHHKIDTGILYHVFPRLKLEKT